MGLTCSKFTSADPEVTAASRVSGLSSSSKKKVECLDPFMHDVMKRSIDYTFGGNGSGNICRKGDKENGVKSENEHNMTGQHHLLFKRVKNTATAANSVSKFSSSSYQNCPSSHPLSLSTSSISSCSLSFSSNRMVHYPTRLVVRRRQARSLEEGSSGTHIYAVRFPSNQPLTGAETRKEKRMHLTFHSSSPPEEQDPRHAAARANASFSTKASVQDPASAVAITTHRRVPVPPHNNEMVRHADHLFSRTVMMEEPKYRVMGWTTISAEHHIYVVDTGLSALDCDELVAITENACRGHYAAYTYAKQTLGCREFPHLAFATRDVVHSVVASIYEQFAEDPVQQRLLLDDREPHIVKYDVTKRERQKLDMHTDKSEWTFLIALSNGCGIDYDGGGTYFECIDATVHVQRGQAVVFPGKLRHCGQRITSGLRFLLVGFLVDKSTMSTGKSGSTTVTSSPTCTDTDFPQDSRATV